MKLLVLPLRARPRLTISALVGVVVAVAIPGEYHNVTRALFGWNVAVWLYLVLVAWMMSRADHERLHRTAMAQAEGAAAMLTVVVLAAMVSLAGLVVELTAAKVPGTPHAWPHLAFALSTVAGSWLLVPTKFAQTYASAHYAGGSEPGLRFPDSGAGFKPDYGDFIYFAFTIAVASQTADVSVVTRSMRRLVLLQSLVSFAFNTAILAFTINVAASMF